MDNSAWEQLEEGEIVDDGFEDISDNSINESAFGKLVSPYGNLRALSLSSDSESDRNRPIRQKRKLVHRKCKIKQHRRRKRARQSSDNSDSDISKEKLKEAIHVSGLEGNHRNTLEARLKAMGILVAIAESLPEPPDHLQENESNDLSDKIDDNELEKLRLEALKTAVLNKHQRRKRKKALEEQELGTPLETLENKENDTPKDEQNEKKIDEKVMANDPIDDFEEDEDLLRASLLAGLANKITKKQAQIESPLQVKQVVPKFPNSIQSVLPKRPINKFRTQVVNEKVINKRIINKRLINKQIANNKVIQKMNMPKPQVKPLIININSDTDSENEPKQNSSTVVPQVLPDTTPRIIVKQLPPKPNPVLHKAASKPKVTDLNAITSNVEKFLKEQRAKFETENKNKQQVNTAKDKKILEKSAVKLLPKSQQLEYQLLLRKLRNAERKKKVRKLALENLKGQAKPEPPKPSSVEVEVHIQESTVAAATVSDKHATPPKVVLSMHPVASTANEKFSSEEVLKSDSNESVAKCSKGSEISERKKSRITSELTTLQKTLKEIKMQRNGSLQIRSKYQVLTPIIRKITTTSNDRKRQEYRIKTLLQELSEARSNLAQSHERFLNFVKELVAKKEKIDKSCQESKVEQRIGYGKIMNDTNDKKVENNPKDMKSVPVTSTPIKSQLEATDDVTISTFVMSSTNNDCEDMDVCNSDETDFGQIDIVDPNDIDQIFKRKSPVKSPMPEYVSPLNFNSYERYSNVDPLGIMCPYEVNGSCRDADCTYKHYLKNHDRL